MLLKGFWFHALVFQFDSNFTTVLFPMFDKKVFLIKIENGLHASMSVKCHGWKPFAGYLPSCTTLALIAIPQPKASQTGRHGIARQEIRKLKNNHKGK